MSISFKRNRVQEGYENLIRGTSPSDYNIEFKTHTLTISEANLLSNLMCDDAVDFYYNGILSFSEGINSMYESRFSWATVKLYYSIYYLMRATMACRGHALLRNKSLLSLKVESSAQPVCSDGRSSNTTHEGTINRFVQLFLTTDRLLTNNIEGQNVYEWMKEAREVVNYKSASFSEPSHLELWDKFAEAIKNKRINDLIAALDTDEYIACFQKEFAVVGVPIKRLKETTADIIDAHLCQKISNEQRSFLRRLINHKQNGLNWLSRVLEDWA